MWNFIKQMTIILSMLFLTACAKPTSTTSVAGTTSGSDGADGTNGKNSLIKTTTESSGTNCTNAGLKIETGLDSDEDGVLDSDEVAATVYVCNGTNGTDGDNGTDGIKPSASLFCTALLENTALYFTYTAMVFSDSSVWAYGGIYGTGFQIGASTFYDSSQNGAATAAVLFTYDVDTSNNGGYWTISLNRSTLVTTILYTDTDASGGSNTWTLASSYCVLNSY